MRGVKQLGIIAAGLAAVFGVVLHSELTQSEETKPAVPETKSTAPAAKPADPKAKPGVVNDAAFHARLLEIAKEYKSYRVVDAGLRWAPVLCGSGDEGVYQVSAAPAGSVHGQKLYALYAKNPKAYVTPGEKLKYGFVIVKESWTAREVPEHQSDVVKDGKFYRPDIRSDLFVMAKLDWWTDGTDNGWVYGTVSPDGKTVTSSGKVESCMGCHVKAKNDRLFGLPAKK